MSVAKMSTIAYNDMFTAIDECLLYAGLKEFYLQKKTGSRRFQVLQMIFFIIAYTNVTVSSSWEVVYGILLQEENMTEWILQEAELCPCAIVSIYSVLKTFVMLVNRKNVYQLVEELREMWPKEEDDPELFRLYQDNIVWTQKFCAFYVKFTTIAGLLYNISPFFTMANNYFTTGHTEYILPYYVWYPFGFEPTKTLRSYALTYITHFSSGLFVCANMASMDAIFCTFMAMITVHFILLSKRLESLSSKRDGKSLSEIQKNLGQLVNLHNRLIRLTKMTESIYGIILLFTLVGSSFLICILVFSVSISPMARIPRFITLLTSTLSQIIMLSFYGDWLLEKGNDVADAIYDSEWTDLGNPSHTKDIVMIIKRTQMEVGISAMGFSVISMKTLSSILSGAWSYFTLINTMYEE